MPWISELNFEKDKLLVIFIAFTLYRDKVGEEIRIHAARKANYDFSANCKKDNTRYIIPKD